MANTIKLKRGSGSDPSASDLVVGELALRTDTGKIFLKKDNGNVTEVSGGGGVSDGDKGDITVSNSGDTFTIDNGVVTLAKMQNVITDTILGRTTNGTGGLEVLSASSVRGIINVEDGATADQTASEIKTLLNSSGLVNAQIDASAAIAGTKISPDFGSQNIVTTGTLGSGNFSLTSTQPRIRLIDSNTNPDLSIINEDGVLNIYDDTNSASRFTIDTGKIVSKLNHDFDAGIDVTGLATVTRTSSGGADEILKVLHSNLTQGIGFGYNTISAIGSNTNVDLRLESKGTGKIYLIDNVNANAGIDVTGGITYTTTSIASAALEFANTLASYDPSVGSTGSDTSTITAISLRFGQQIAVNKNGYIRNLIKINSSSDYNIEIGHTDTNYIGDILLHPGLNHSVRLRYNGSDRLVTDSTGVDITGELATTSHIRLPDNAELKLGNATNGDFVLIHNATDSIINNATGHLFYRSATHKLQNLAGTDRLVINSDGHIDIAGNLDVGAGIDVTGNIDITNGTLIIDTNPDSPNTSFGLQEALRIDDAGNTVDRGLNIYEYRQGGARFYSLNMNLASGSTGSAYTYTQGNWGGSSMMQFTNGSTIFYADAQVTGGSTDVITPTKRFEIDTSGVTVTGNLAVTGTVDGRDLASDGTKLDGIESSATADQTASEIKTLLNSNGIVNAQIDASAAIAGSKISPNFGSQNIFTTGNIKAEGASSLLQVGDTGNDNYVQLTQITNSSSVRGFTNQHNNASVLENLQGTTNQHLVLGDVNNNNSGTLFGVSLTESGTTVTRLSLSGSGNLNVHNNITLGGTVDGVDIAARDTLFGTLTDTANTLKNSVRCTTFASSENSTRLASTAFVQTAIALLVDSSPSTLNTLNELAAALGDDANFSTTVTNSIATKLPLAGGTLTGNVKFNDSVELQFGSSGNTDSLIKFDSNNLIIQETSASGSMNVRGQNLRLQNPSESNENYIECIGDNANRCVKIYQASTVRLQTTSTGVTVTGTCTATTFSGSGASLTNVNATTLDSIDSGSFLRSDANDDATGNFNFSDSGGSDDPVIHVKHTGSANGNYGGAFLCENQYGNHSYGMVAEFRIGASGQDRPAISFSSGNSNTHTWGIGFVDNTTDHFRIRHGYGFRAGGWGTTRFSIHTDGTL